MIGRAGVPLVITIICAATMLTAFERADEPTMNYVEKVNLAARKVHSNQPEDLRPLLLAVLDEQADVSIPLSERARSRILRAESKFRIRIGRGIRPIDLAKALNAAVKELELPPFAHVTVSQITDIKVALTRSTPGLFLEGKDLSKSASGELSPLEAVYISSMVLQQKLYNERYQKTPEEWEADRAIHNNADRKTPPRGGASVRVRNTPKKTIELSGKLREALEYRDTTELDNLVQRILTIARVEE